MSYAVELPDFACNYMRTEGRDNVNYTRQRVARTVLSRSVLLGILWMLATNPSFSASTAEDVAAKRVSRILANTPLIDGHNDLAWELKLRKQSTGDFPDLAVNQAQNRIGGLPPLMTDIPRLLEGHVGGQFWSVWIPPSTVGPAAVQATMEQIDLVKQLAARYPRVVEMAYTVADIQRIHRLGKVASLIGVEGGHQINESLAVLRQYYDAGVRYMALTHTLNTRWADSATDNPAHDGLTLFGKEVIHEINRLGMLVDISHVSPKTMKSALETSASPVIFSHSSSRQLVDHPRNVPDDVLQLVAKNHGIVMVNFATGYISQARNRWNADRAAEQARFNAPPYAGLYIGQPTRADSALAAWELSNPKPSATLSQVADHIEHIRAIAGADAVGLGSDFDGIEDTPEGLSGVNCFPALLAELIRRGWSDEDVAKLAGQNILRVLAAAESVSARLRETRLPSSATIEKLDAISAHSD